MGVNRALRAATGKDVGYDVELEVERDAQPRGARAAPRPKDG